MGPSGGHRQRSFMTFYDRPADRQPHAHTLGLCRKERVEDAVQVLRIDPCSGVFHGAQYTIEFVWFTLYSQNPRTIFYCTHCVNGIEDRKSTRLNSSHSSISYAVFCL